jgi:phosphoglucosamine mutase
LLQARVIEEGAQIGIALDGDADRLIVVDEQGRIIDGDQLMALIGVSWANRGMLKGDGIVATVMSNLGLERYLQSRDLKLLRTKVGTGTCSRRCARAATMSAASNRATSSFPIIRPPATG